MSKRQVRGKGSHTRPRARPLVRVFLSHSTADREFAKQFRVVLKNLGVNVWFSATSIIGAQEWLDAIGRALSRCNWFVVILSPAAAESRMLRAEVKYAVNAAKYEGRIVPIMKEDCDTDKILWVLRNIQFVDFREDFSEGCKGLKKAFGHHLRGLRRRSG